MTEKLVPLEEVARFGRNIVRILGGNPGKFTLQGTNTYLIAAGSSAGSTSSRSCILVDTAEGKPSYAPLLRQILDGQDARAGPSRCDISDIVLTHRHHDHVGGLPSVLAMLAERRRQGGQDQQIRPPRIHKFADAETDPALYAQLKGLDVDTYMPASGSPIWPLEDGDDIRLADSDKEDGPLLRVVHTPGHTKDHICLWVHDDGALLTGDHVLGQGTSVFEDLGTYLSSLRKCLAVIEQQHSTADKSQGPTLYPAHGPVIEQGKEALEKYLAHRLEREEQVLQLLAQSRNGDVSASAPEWTIPELVSNLYSNYPETLYPAAARGLFLHLHKLGRADQEAVQRGVVADDDLHGRRVRCTGDVAGQDGLAPDVPSSEAEWMRVMDLKWSLLAHNSSSSHASHDSITMKGSL